VSRGCEDAGLLSQIIYNTRGNDHLEIGSAAGGSALITLKAMNYCGRKDKVVCIDPHGNRSPEKPMEDSFWENISSFGFRDRIEYIKAYSHPFPEVLEGRT
jgi:predicted O-methyltransferase YrrM